MYDKVVGHSYVPDMVEEIGEAIQRLKDRLANPGTRYTADVIASFADMEEEVIASMMSMAEGMDKVLDDMVNRVTRAIGDYYTDVDGISYDHLYKYRLIAVSRAGLQSDPSDETVPAEPGGISLASQVIGKLASGHLAEEIIAELDGIVQIQEDLEDLTGEVSAVVQQAGELSQVVAQVEEGLVTAQSDIQQNANQIAHRVQGVKREDVVQARFAQLPIPGGNTLQADHVDFEDILDGIVDAQVKATVVRGTPSLVEAWDAIADIGADVMHLITRQDRSRIRTTGYYQINVSPTYATSWTGAFYAGFDPGPSEYLMNCPLNPKTGERLASEVLVTFIAIDTFLEVRTRLQ